MISWSPVCQMLRHYNTGTIRIPISNLFKDFKINFVKLEKDEIIISLFHKDHYFSKPK